MSATALRDDYTTFCENVRELSGIDLLQYKRGQMERRIRSFMQTRGVADLPLYVRLLRSDATELDAFVDRVTINVSQLWRNPDQWRLLSSSELPELAKTGRIRCWSAGSSYGAEAYTLAALALDAAKGARVEVTGTDIDKRMIERARAGRFSADDGRDVPRQLLDRWFDRDGDELVAKPALAAATTFEAGDLLRMPFPKDRYDLVLCRNTVIYFEEPVRDALHGRLVGAIRPGGYLLIGATERVADPAAIDLEPVRPFLYRKAV